MLTAFSTIIDLVFPPREDERAVRAAPDDALTALMWERDALVTDPKAVSLLPFRHALVRATIHEAKYRGNARAQAMLSRVLAAFLDGKDVVIVPIPLSGTRRKERGFNQCERIASLAGATIENDVLFRTRDTGHQVKLARNERLLNVKDAFEARNVDEKTRYVLLDDVITTGATMQAAIDAMKRAGATEVLPLAIAG